MTGEVDMLLRILKRAQNYEFDPISTLTKKKQAIRVGKGIATKNPIYTSVIQVHEAFHDCKQSQEIYSMLKQRASYEDTPERLDGFSSASFDWSKSRNLVGCNC